MTDNKYENVELNSNHHSEPDNQLRTNYFTYMRGTLITTILVLLILNSHFGYFLPNGNINCINDKTFELTTSINTFLKDNPYYRNALLIASSLCMDILIVSILALWFLYGRSWRLLVALFTFYSFRSIVQV